MNRGIHVMELTPQQKQLYIEALTKNLPVLRARLGLSQQELAKRVGLARQTMVSIETGRRPMMWQTFLSILMLFYCNPKTEPLLSALGIYNQQLEEFFVS